MKREQLSELLNISIIRYGLAVAYTALLLVTLLQSSQHPVIGPAMPEGPVPLERELLLIMAHFIGFGLLTALWTFALRLTMPLAQALTLAMVLALVISISTELLQTLVPDRGASWLDFFTNLCAILTTSWLIWRGQE